MIRVGILGLGVGERHIRCFDAHPECEVTVLCDPDEVKLQEVGKRYPKKKRERDPGKVLTDGEIDVISIASPDNYHIDQALAAIQNGKHVFIEKPVCLTREERDRLKAALERHPSIKMSSNLVLRLSSRFQEIRSLIQNGKFGLIYYLEGDYQYGRMHKLKDGWRGSIPYYSVMLGGGVHIIDLLLWMTGETVREVSAYGNRICSVATGFSHQDFSVALLKMESGVIAKVSANFGCQRPHFHALEVHGTDKVFFNAPEEGLIYSSGEKELAPEKITTPYRDYQKIDLIYSFIDYVVHGSAPLVSASEVFRVTDVCLAINESMARNQPVSLSEFAD